MHAQRDRHLNPSIRTTLLLLALIVWSNTFLVSSLATTPSSGLVRNDGNSMIDPPNDQGIRLAHLGNSIQYYNDCPRLLEWMLKVHYGADQVTQDSCLRGGASLVSLLVKGNGMANKFATPSAVQPDGTYDIGRPTVTDLLDSNSWDFVIMNDHTQAPARNESQKASQKALVESYLPMLGRQQPTPPVVVFLMTAAYRKPVKGSAELGNFDEFTTKLAEGYATYQALIPNSKVAPVGLAYQYIYHRWPSLTASETKQAYFTWEWLYARDDFHPSPHGTLLEAYVLFATIVGQAPPKYDFSWWDTARYMQPPETEPLPLPTAEHGELLRHVACTICSVPMENSGSENED